MCVRLTAKSFFRRMSISVQHFHLKMRNGDEAAMSTSVPSYQTGTKTSPGFSGPGGIYDL